MPGPSVPHKPVAPGVQFQAVHFPAPQWPSRPPCYQGPSTASGCLPSVPSAMWGDRGAAGVEEGQSPARVEPPRGHHHPLTSGTQGDKCGEGSRAGLGSCCEIGAGERERNPSPFIRKPTGIEDQSWAHTVTGGSVGMGSPSPRLLPPLSQGGPAGRLGDPGASWGCPDLWAPSSFTAPASPHRRAAAVPAPFPREVPGSDFSGS